MSESISRGHENDLDLISRQAAIDEVVAWLEDYMTDKKNGKPLTDRLKDLPSAQPQRVRGRWKRTYLDLDAMGERSSIFYCSECSQCIAFPTNYCPSCGADMRGEQECTKNI